MLLVAVVNHFFGSDCPLHTAASSMSFRPSEYNRIESFNRRDLSVSHVICNAAKFVFLHAIKSHQNPIHNHVQNGAGIWSELEPGTSFPSGCDRSTSVDAELPPSDTTREFIFSQGTQSGGGVRSDESALETERVLYEANHSSDGSEDENDATIVPKGNEFALLLV